MVYNTKGKVKRAQHLPVFLPPKPLMALSSQSKINDKKEDIAQFIKQIIEELYKIYESKSNKYKDASGGSNDIDAEGQASAGTGTQETSDGTKSTKTTSLPKLAPVITSSDLSQKRQLK